MSNVGKEGLTWQTVPQAIVLNFVAERAKETKFIEKVVLFGSRARGNSRPFSDYDLAFKLAEGTQSLEWLVFKLNLDEDAPTLCQLSSVEWTGSIRPELLANVRSEGVTIYER